MLLIYLQWKTIIDDGVYKILTVEDNTGKLFYMKSSTAAGTGDLYHDKRRLTQCIRKPFENGWRQTYIYHSTGENMTYKAYDMSEVSTIANKVDTYCISLPEGIAFLKDYYEIGDIYLYDGNQVVKKLVSKVQFFNMSFPFSTTNTNPGSNKKSHALTAWDFLFQISFPFLSPNPAFSHI